MISFILCPKGLEFLPRSCVMPLQVIHNAKFLSELQAQCVRRCSDMRLYNGGKPVVVLEFDQKNTFCRDFRTKRWKTFEFYVKQGPGRPDGLYLSARETQGLQLRVKNMSKHELQVLTWQLRCMTKHQRSISTNYSAKLNNKNVSRLPFKGK